MSIFNIPKGFFKKEKKYDTINDLKIPYINLDINTSDNSINGEYVYPGYPERGFTFTYNIQDDRMLRIIYDYIGSKSEIMNSSNSIYTFLKLQKKFYVIKMIKNFLEHLGLNLELTNMFICLQVYSLIIKNLYCILKLKNILQKKYIQLHQKILLLKIG